MTAKPEILKPFSTEKEQPKAEVHEAPKVPETQEELDASGSAWEAYIEDSSEKAKDEAGKKFEEAPARIGVSPEMAAEAATAAGVPEAQKAAEKNLDTAAEQAKKEIAAEVGPEAGKAVIEVKWEDLGDKLMANILTSMKDSYTKREKDNVASLAADYKDMEKKAAAIAELKNPESTKVSDKFKEARVDFHKKVLDMINPSWEEDLRRTWSFRGDETNKENMDDVIKEFVDKIAGGSWVEARKDGKRYKVQILDEDLKNLSREAKEAITKEAAEYAPIATAENTRTSLLLSKYEALRSIEPAREEAMKSRLGRGWSDYENLYSFVSSSIYNLRKRLEMLKSK